MKNRKQKFGGYKSQDLKDLAPLQFINGKTNPFKVPENYFDNLPLEILFKTTNLTRVTRVKRLSWDFIQPKYAIASAIVLILIIVSIIIVSRSVPTGKQELADFTLEEILLENPDLIESMDDDLLLECLFASAREDKVTEFDSISFIDKGINNSELLEFLSQEYLTPDLFYNL